jgi:hypothetical protein
LSLPQEVSIAASTKNVKRKNSFRFFIEMTFEFFMIVQIEDYAFT